MIIHTKLQPPSIAPDIVVRHRLTARLDEGRSRPLTLVSAPAGYGKSTLAIRWTAACDCPCGWVSLDKGENDLRMFLEYLVAAIQRIFPRSELRIGKLLEADRLPTTAELAQYLLNDLHQVPEPFNLVLDDYQRITERPVHDFIASLLEHPAQTMHLVLLTRKDPLLPIAVMRGRGLVTEIRASDLRFTPDEAAAFLSRMLKVAVDDATAAILESKIQGWAAGLRLVGLYLKGRKDLKRHVQEMSGSSGHIAEYLAAEVLSRQHPEMVSYLLETAILDRFCAPLCRQIHQMATQGRSGKPEIDAEQFIQWLVDANLFVIPLDNQGYWFRYHHLFQAFLKHMLRKQAGADRIAELHLIASNWLAGNGLIDEAIRQALAASDTQGAVRLVVKHRYDLMNNAKYHRLNNWLALLPRDIVAETPLLVTTQAITAWVSGQREDVTTYTEKAKRLFETLSPESSEYGILQGEILTLQNLVSILSGEPVNAYADAQNALELLPKKALFFRMMAIGEMAFFYQMKGDLNQGATLLKDELKATDLPLSIQARGWFYLCAINYMDSNTSEILLSGLNSLEIVDNPRLAHTRGGTKYFVGATYYLHNELTKAKSYLQGVLNDRAFTNAIYVIQTCGILGFIYLAEGFPEKAEAVIGQAVDSAWEIQDNYSPAIRKALRVELALRQGMGDEARRLALGVNFDLLPPTWFVYVPQLTKIKLLLADGTDRSIEEARSRLVEMDQTMRSINRKCVLIDILAILALVHHKMGKQKVAQEKLHEALNLAEPGGWIRNFVDLGLPMTRLLERLNHFSPGQKYAQQVLKACQAEHHKNAASEPDATTKPGISEHPSHHVLTRREIEILPLLAEGLSSKEIAARLYIAPVTVKKHLQNIYSKLNAKNRVEALKKAREIGIIIDYLSHLIPAND